MKNNIRLEKLEQNKIRVVFKDEYSRVQKTLKIENADIEQITLEVNKKENFVLSDFINKYPKLHDYICDGGHNSYHHSTMYYLSSVKASLACGYPFYIGSENGGLDLEEIDRLTMLYYNLPEDYIIIHDKDEDFKFPLSVDDAVSYIVFYGGFKDMVNDIDVKPISIEYLKEKSNEYKAIAEKNKKRDDDLRQEVKETSTFTGCESEIPF